MFQKTLYTTLTDSNVHKFKGIENHGLVVYTLPKYVLSLKNLQLNYIFVFPIQDITDPKINLLDLVKETNPFLSSDFLFVDEYKFNEFRNNKIYFKNNDRNLYEQTESLEFCQANHDLLETITNDNILYQIAHTYHINNLDHDALRYLDKLILSPYVNPEIYSDVIHDSRFYVKPLPLEVKTKILANNLWINDAADYNSFNPSIVMIGQQLYLNLRMANWQYWPTQELVLKDLKGYHRTRNYLTKFNLTDLTEGLLVLNGHELRKSKPFHKINKSDYRGIEDLRYVTHDNKVFAIGSSMEYNENGVIKTVLLEINPDKNKIIGLKPLNYQLNLKHEKNWLPFVYKSSEVEEIHYIYSYHPFIVLNSKMEEVINRQYLFKFDQLRGSAAPLRIPEDNLLFKLSGNYLMMVHHTNWVTKNEKNILQYCQRFVLLDYELNIIRVSNPFYLVSDDIEFVMSMFLTSSHLYVSLGVQDLDSYIVTLSLQTVYNALMEGNVI